MKYGFLMLRPGVLEICFGKIMLDDIITLKSK